MVMSLQYLADYTGNPTAVVIPIREWKILVEKYSELKDLIPPAGDKKRIPLMKEFEGLLSQEEGKSLLQHVEQSRKEWDSGNI